MLVKFGEVELKLRPNHIFFSSVNYVDAMASAQRLRSQPPALYNYNRLVEKPIPNVSIPLEEIFFHIETTDENNINSESVENMEESMHIDDNIQVETFSEILPRTENPDPLELPSELSSNNDDAKLSDSSSSLALVEFGSKLLRVGKHCHIIGNVPVHSSFPIATCIDLRLNRNEVDSSTELHHCESQVLSIADTAVADCESTARTMDVKQEQLEDLMRIHEIPPQNIEQISELLSEPEKIVIDDDCSMTFINFPSPFRATRDGLIKQENNVISGNIPFFPTVRLQHFFFLSSSYNFNVPFSIDRKLDEFTELRTL